MKTLQNRFDNNNLLIENYIEATFEIESIHAESASIIRKTLNNLDKHLMVLPELG